MCSCRVLDSHFRGNDVAYLVFIAIFVDDCTNEARCRSSGLVYAWDDNTPRPKEKKDTVGTLEPFDVIRPPMIPSIERIDSRSLGVAAGEASFFFLRGQPRGREKDTHEKNLY